MSSEALTIRSFVASGRGRSTRIGVGARRTTARPSVSRSMDAPLL